MRAGTFSSPCRNRDGPVFVEAQETTPKPEEPLDISRKPCLPTRVRAEVVRRGRLELPRDFSRQPLKLMRLPFRHLRMKQWIVRGLNPASFRPCLSDKWVRPAPSQSICPKNRPVAGIEPANLLLRKVRLPNRSGRPARLFTPFGEVELRVGRLGWGRENRTLVSTVSR